MEGKSRQSKQTFETSKIDNITAFALAEKPGKLNSLCYPRMFCLRRMRVDFRFRFHRESSGDR